MAKKMDLQRECRSWVNINPVGSRQAQCDSSVGNLQLTIIQRYINLAAVVNFGVIILASWESFAVSKYICTKCM